MSSDSESYETVRLKRLGRTTDLWPAVESAQFARIIIYEAAASDDDEHAIEAFVDAFSALVEAWDVEDEGRNRAFLFDGVDSYIRALERKKLFVHLGCVERTVAEPEGGDVTVIPVAVIRIGRSAVRSTTVRLPSDLTVNPAEDARPH
jgi:hypothetical protein